MLKFEGKFKEGDYIRAYDFEPMRGRGECYIEGKIVTVNQYNPSMFGGDASYSVMVERDMFSGAYSELRVGLVIKVTMEISNDYDHRIFKL